MIFISYDKDFPIEDWRLTLDEYKTLDAVVDWGKLGMVVRAPVGAGKTGALLSLLRQLRATNRRANLREFLDVLENAKVVKTKVSRHYLELVAMRPLLRMQVWLRQKLANSAPASRLVLMNRVRHIFATHPPVAPPQSA